MVICVSKLLRGFLSASRKRRCMMVSFTVWLLRQVCAVENDEMLRFSDKLDEFNLNRAVVPKHSYIAVEDEYLNCECVLETLESAIDDLGFAY